MTSRKPQESDRHAFHLLLVTVLCITLTSYAARLMGYYRGLALGADALELGLLASSFALLSMAFALPLGRAIDRWGGRRFALGGVAMISLSALIMARAEGIWVLAVGLAFLGLGQTAAVVANQSTVVLLENGKSTESRFGHFSAMASVGQLTGPTLAGAVAGISGGPPNTAAALLVAGGIAAFGFLTAALTAFPSRRTVPARHNDAHRGHTRGALAGILSTSGMGRTLLVSMSVLSSIDILTAYLPALGEAHGLSVQTVGVLLSTRAAASLASRVVMARLLDWLGRRRLLILSVTIPAFGLALLPLIPVTWLLFVAMAAVGFGLGLGQPVTLAWVATHTPAEFRGTAISIRMGANRFAQVAFPGIVGLVAGAMGIYGAFACLSVTLAASGVSLFNAPIDKE